MASAQQRQTGLRQQPLGAVDGGAGVLLRHGQPAGVDAVAGGATL
jgi:hypothetical protein